MPLAVTIALGHTLTLPKRVLAPKPKDQPVPPVPGVDVACDRQGGPISLSTNTDSADHAL